MLPIINIADSNILFNIFHLILFLLLRLVRSAGSILLSRIVLTYCINKSCQELSLTQLWGSRHRIANSQAMRVPFPTCVITTKQKYLHMITLGIIYYV